MFSQLLKRSRSKPRLRADSERYGDLADTSVSSPYASGIVPFLPISSSPPSPTYPIIKRDKFRGKKKSSARPPPLPPKDRHLEPEFKLDTNIDDMKGIVNVSVLSSACDISTPVSGFDETQSSGLSHSDGFPATPSSSIFSNPFPFLPTIGTVNRPYVALDHRKVSPKTILHPSAGPTPSADASWTAPESWSVEREGEHLDEPGYSSTDDSVAGGGRPTSMTLGAARRKGRRRTMKPSKPQLSYQTYKVRIFRADGNFHVAAIGLSVTVADLGPVLDQRLLKDKDRESHRLYLKERGRGEIYLENLVSFCADVPLRSERILAQTERPADIARRRLEQCGYDESDGLEALAAGDLSFLFKFVYKSQSLGHSVRLFLVSFTRLLFNHVRSCRKRSCPWITMNMWT